MRGHTLLELTLVVALMTVSAAAFVPTARRHRDLAAVFAAREAIVALLSEARLAAISTGKAKLVIDSDPWRAWVETAEAVLPGLSIESDSGVSVVLAGNSPRTEISFGALGVGRMASQTIEFRRGDARTSLIVSSLGRVRRR